MPEPETVDGRDVIGVWSQGVFFPIGEPEAEEAFDDEDEAAGYRSATGASSPSSHPG